MREVKLNGLALLLVVLEGRRRSGTMTGRGHKPDMVMHTCL